MHVTNYHDNFCKQQFTLFIAYSLWTFTPKKETLIVNIHSWEQLHNCKATSHDMERMRKRKIKSWQARIQQNYAINILYYLSLGRDNIEKTSSNRMLKVFNLLTGTYISQNCFMYVQQTHIHTDTDVKL